MLLEFHPILVDSNALSMFRAMENQSKMEPARWNTYAILCKVSMETINQTSEINGPNHFSDKRIVDIIHYQLAKSFLFLQKLPHLAMFTSAEESGTVCRNRAYVTILAVFTVFYLQPDTERGALWSTRIGYRQTRDWWQVTERCPLFLWFISRYGSPAKLQYVKILLN